MISINNIYLLDIEQKMKCYPHNQKKTAIILSITAVTADHEYQTKESFKKEFGVSITCIIKVMIISCSMIKNLVNKQLQVIHGKIEI